MKSPSKLIMEAKISGPFGDESSGGNTWSEDGGLFEVVHPRGDPKVRDRCADIATIVWPTILSKAVPVVRRTQLSQYRNIAMYQSFLIEGIPDGLAPNFYNC